jgi:predicted dehydrogenase
LTLPAALPEARTPDPLTAPSLRWGVIGTGWIADRFVASLRQHSSQQVIAVGSRTLESALSFADRHALAAAYGSYEELVADGDVDVVYVATPHNAHLPVALLSLGAGRHTLVEKPLGATADEARRIAAAAEAAGVFCMEAMWTAFLPKFDVIGQLLDSGALGEPLSVVADFGEWFAEGHRILDPALAGGPLLDLGTYLVAFALDVLGPVDRVQATGDRVPTGVLGQVGALLDHSAGGRAALHTTLRSNTPTTAVIAGSDATLVIDGPFYQPGGFTVTPRDGGRSLRYDEQPIAHQALHLQAAEVARRIMAGDTGSPLRPLASSVRTLEVLDAIAAGCS